MKIPTFVKASGWVVFIITLFFILLIGGVFLLLFGEDLKTQRHLNKELSRQREENARIQAEIDEIQEKLAKLDNPEYLEYLARQKGLVFPEEKVIIYKEKDNEKGKRP